MKPVTEVRVQLNYTSRQVVFALGSMRLFQRLVFSGWLLPLDSNSKDKLYPVSRVLAVQERMQIGEMPPLLPSELRQRKARCGAAKNADEPTA